MKQPLWEDFTLNYYRHRYPDAVRACVEVLDHIAKSRTHFRNHDKLVYWLSKPNGLDDWCDVLQNILVVCFLHDYCDLLPMTPSEDAYDTSGEAVMYEEVVSGIFWKRSASVWLHAGDEDKVAYRLWPAYHVQGEIIWQRIDEFEEYNHVQNLWEAYGNYVPEEESGSACFKDLAAWKAWILA